VTGRSRARRTGEIGVEELRFSTKKHHSGPTSTGALRASWRYESQKQGDTRRIVWTSDLPYAEIHNRGGVIRPRKAKVLTIPQTPLARRIKKGPRFFPGRLAPTRYGLIDIQGTHQYYWANQARIKGSGYIDEALAATERRTREEIDRSIRRHLRGRVSLRRPST